MSVHLHKLCCLGPSCHAANPPQVARRLPAMVGPGLQAVGHPLAAAVHPPAAAVRPLATVVRPPATVVCLPATSVRPPASATQSLAPSVTTSAGPEIEPQEPTAGREGPDMVINILS